MHYCRWNELNSFASQLTHVPLIRPFGLPIYVARVPAAPLMRCCFRGFALITRTAPCLRQVEPTCIP